MACDQASRAETSNLNFSPRLQTNDEKYGLTMSTRISTWNSRDRDREFCLVLVDRLAHIPNGRSQVYLPVSNNRGGLTLPQGFDQAQHSLYECLNRFLSHSWHFDVLFPATSVAIEPTTFLYLVVASTWGYNLRLLGHQIKRIGFEDIRGPTTSINDKLHDHRRDLTSLQEQVEMARIWMPQVVHEQLRKIKSAAGKDQIYIGFPDDALNDIFRRAETLDKFLMDSFHLLISSTSVLGTELSIAQGVRGSRLTMLAFLYVPLSFVTGVFGMNVREINGSALSVWVPVVVLAVVTAITVAILAGYVQWERHRARQIPIGGVFVGLHARL